MNQEIILRGIVLSNSQVAEYDKRLVVLTPERGRITVFANGARRPQSRFAAASQNFTMGKFTVREGRNAYYLVGVEIENSFQELIFDIEKMCYASYMCEFVMYYTHEGVRANDELNLLYVSFMALIHEKIPYSLIKCIFELKLMEIEGQGINAEGCVKCQKKDNIRYIDVYAGGLICEECKHKVRRPIMISNDAIYTIRYILASKISTLYSFTLKEEVLREVSQIIESFVDEYVDCRFNSLKILNTLG